jgi:acyl carrier protein
MMNVEAEEEIRDWLIQWFKKNALLTEDEISSKIDENYFQRGWIDSFQFISFLTEIEGRFHIHFSNAEFQDRTFSTIEGLTEIIEKKVNEEV